MQREEVEKLIQPFSSDKMTENKSEELLHVGKFLALIKGSKIIERPDPPDFIISYKNEKIGLEHERILIFEKAKKLKSTQRLFEDSAKLFSEKYPGFNFLAVFYLTTDELTFQSKDKSKLKSEIVKYIYALKFEKERIKKPSFIDKVIFMEHYGVGFTYNPGAYFVNYLSTGILREHIQKKEDLIAKYIEKSKLDRQWLLLVSGMPFPYAYEIGDIPINIEIESRFERIYLMEDSSYKIFRIK